MNSRPFDTKVFFTNYSVILAGVLVVTTLVIAMQLLLPLLGIAVFSILFALAIPIFGPLMIGTLIYSIFSASRLIFATHTTRESQLADVVLTVCISLELLVLLVLFSYA